MNNRDNSLPLTSEVDSLPMAQTEPSWGHQGYVIKRTNPVGTKFLEYAKSLDSPNLMDIGCGNGFPVAIPALQSGARLMCVDGMEERIEELITASDELEIQKENFKSIAAFYPGGDSGLTQFGG
jgi:2-polyprenyl-3-methyl-5-hydroxy-6-metoxy-1,4-benzoquinol methylase